MPTDTMFCALTGVLQGYLKHKPLCSKITNISNKKLSYEMQWFYCSINRNDVILLLIK